MTCLVTFRFYEELNFFLHTRNNKEPIICQFGHTTTVKDAIESLGVPHTEIDLILANGRQVNFNYIIKQNDFISVYPVFETLDISGVSPLHKNPLRNPKFILDVHLGKLTKYLRILGFDCKYDTNLTDHDIIFQAVDEKRIILTRDLGLLKNHLVTHGYFIRSQQPKEQTLEVIRRFQLDSLIKPFSRCTRCNTFIRAVPKELIIDRLEFRTKEYYDDFYQCSGCGWIYWKGSHYERMVMFINDIKQRPI